jgi:transposase-like protein
MAYDQTTAAAERSASLIRGPAPSDRLWTCHACGSRITDKSKPVARCLPPLVQYCSRECARAGMEMGGFW